MLGRSVMNESLNKNNPTYPFQNVAGILNAADIVFGNLENPIIKDCRITTSGMIFCTKPEMINGLKYAGVDILSIANNHAKNYGDSGFFETKKYLNENTINYVGDGNLIIKDIDGTKFGFLGFNFLDTYPKDLDIDLIKESKTKVNVLIAMVHWGSEYTPEPTKAQKNIAESLIGSGVDVIAGVHPHWVQGVDKINDKVIFYSLGNFIFDQAWSEDTKKGLAIRLNFQKDKLTKIEELPLYMKNFAQPEWIK